MTKIKTLFNALLLSSMIALTACGDGKNDTAAPDPAPVEDNVNTGETDTPANEDNMESNESGSEEADMPATGGSIPKPEGKDQEAGTLLLQQAQMYFDTPEEQYATFDQGTKDTMTSVMEITVELLSDEQKVFFNELIQLIKEEKREEAKDIYDQLTVTYDYEPVDLEKKAQEYKDSLENK
ncbi:hypothetical protein [Paenibacillus lemnae]|uniref:Lipoprotein n=1 Tax=Paenibacillus lemnae TaxID=1330551 RepID=A0A848M317_PAELE|nr:hypothetical protein [Paenibacillus lemnae]NMO95155.1 hypothetical protein [Paenibacillus lemnae]